LAIPTTWAIFKESPFVGLGFWADRLYLQGQNVHNTLIDALIQSGLLGTIPFVLALLIAWVATYRLGQKAPCCGSEPFLAKLSQL